MKKDPIIDEVRKAREEHAAKFNYNLADIADDLRKKERQRKYKIVSLPAKLFLKETGPD